MTEEAAFNQPDVEAGIRACCERSKIPEAEIRRILEQYRRRRDAIRALWYPARNNPAEPMEPHVSTFQRSVDQDAALSMAAIRRIQIGCPVQKSKGFKFPGIVIGHCFTKANKLRVVVEADHPDFAGMLHIYDPDQLEPRDA